MLLLPALYGEIGVLVEPGPERLADPAPESGIRVPDPTAGFVGHPVSRCRLPRVHLAYYAIHHASPLAL
jgi:hypothetical protein